MSKLISIIRDLILFGILLLLLKLAMERKETSQQPTGHYLSAATQQINTESEPQEDLDLDSVEQPVEQSEPEPIEFSMPQEQDPAQPENPQEPQEAPATEPKRDTISTIQATDQQIGTLLSLTSSTSNEAAQLKSMRQRLSELKQSYQRIMALDKGQDNAAIIQMGMKKDQIEASVLRIAQLVGRIIRVHADLQQQATEYDSINQAISENDKLLNELKNKISA